MVELYNNKIGIEARWLVDNGVISYDNLKKKVVRKKVKRLRRGGNGRSSLIAYRSLPEDVQEQIKRLIGNDPVKMVQNHWFEDYLRPDANAYNYYAAYLTMSGKHLSPEVVKKYNTQAMFLNALTVVHKEKRGMQRRMPMSTERYDFWQRISNIINELEGKYRHGLPEHHGSLRNKYRKYRKEGYEALISQKHNLRNALKANEQVVRLVLSMYVQNDLPFADRVHERYLDFIEGKIEIVDTNTGEIFNREDFSKNGKALKISESLVHNILNNPRYEDLKNQLRSDYGKYKLNASPYVRRKLPEYTLSKISVDDRMIRKGTDHDAWMYAAYEPTSQVFLAVAFDRDSADTPLVMDLLRNLYTESIKHKLYWAGEIEHEHHLFENKQIREMLDRLFAYRRVCNPSNSREKHIEHGFKLLKYGAEKEIFDNTGRWWGKGAYKNKADFKETLRYEQIIAMEMEAIKLHNSMEHPHFKGKTRWEVLLENMNPDLSAPVKFRILKELGNRTDTSIQRSDFVRVQYEDYLIDRNRMHLLKPYHKDVQAYWLPEDDGTIKEVYLWQDDTYICRADKAERFNESLMEQTDEDKAIQLEQQKRLQKHLKHTKEQKEKLITGKLEIIKKEQLQEMELEPVKVHVSEPVNDAWDIDYENEIVNESESAFEDL